ncbi:MAG: galactose mutarotase [Rikenellaceae bacterium]|nr:galactose mutarotase [Rikenellaceae bacterium]
MTSEGEAVLVYKITNTAGASVELCNIGASIIAINVPDSEGNMTDVALGYKEWQSYLQDPAAMCKSVGRYANRIADGRFELNGKEFILARNNGPNHLHGGVDGFGTRVWEGSVEGNQVVFTLTSEDGDQGYPGELAVQVAYYWSEENELDITYRAVSSDDTIVNLTNHLYLNLDGAQSGSVLHHTLQLNCSKFLPINSVQIPTGELADVEGTPMDFRSAKSFAQDFDSDFNYMQQVRGYDHCFVVDDWKRNILGKVGCLMSEKSGRKVEILSSQPGVQIYTGNWLQDAPANKEGKRFHDHDGVAIECQAWPDSPNHPDFPSVELKAGEMYIQKIVYRFGLL